MGLNATASVVFVPDFNREFDYSPYLMSKFVYQVYGDRPIVVYAKKESCMADYCRKYPEAGLFFAEMDNIEALVSALRAAFKCNPVEIQREAIRNEFSAQVIARRFEQDVKACCEIP